MHFLRRIRRHKNEIIMLAITVALSSAIISISLILDNREYVDELETNESIYSSSSNGYLQSNEVSSETYSSLDNAASSNTLSANDITKDYSSVALLDGFDDAPITLWKKDSKYKAQHDFEQYIYDTSIYVDCNRGNDITGNGSKGNPYKTIKKATQNIVSDTNIYVKSNKPLLRGEGFPAGYSPDFNVSIFNANDDGTQIISTTAQGGLEWLQKDGVYVTTRSNAKGLLYKDDAESTFGWSTLPQKSTLNECKNTKGSFYIDGDSVYVNTFDSLSPTEDKYLVCVVSGENQFYPKDDKTIFIEGFTFIGAKGFSCVEFNKKTAGNASATVVLKNCIAGQNDKYIGETYFGNGFAFDNIKNIILFDCIAKNCRRDGFNYHLSTAKNTSECLVVEADCKAYNCGIYDSTSNNNLTTCHNGMRIIRVNTYGRNCNGPMLADVGGCKSLNYGCDIAENKNCSYSYYFELCNKGEATIIDCKADDKQAIASEGTLCVERFIGKIHSSTTVK